MTTSFLFVYIQDPSKTKTQYVQGLSIYFTIYGQVFSHPPPTVGTVSTTDSLWVAKYYGSQVTVLAASGLLVHKATTLIHQLEEFARPMFMATQVDTS